MSCPECKERAQLIREAIAAYRAGDMDTYWSKLKIATAKFGQDVMALAKFFQTDQAPRQQ